jgi:hypothetical protein
MRLSTALLATMPRREFSALVDAGCIDKGDLRTITALRAGDSTGAVAKQRIFETVKKRFAPADTRMQKLARGVYEYAKQRFAEQEKPMTDLLLEERVAKSRDTQAMLSNAVKAYQQQHPGATRADCIDKILYSPEVTKMLQLERQLDEVAKARNTLPQQKPGTMLTRHNTGVPVRGTTGYDSSVADTHPQNPDNGEEVTIRDQNEILEGLKSGRIPYNDPRASAQVAPERKRIFAKD